VELAITIGDYAIAESTLPTAPATLEETSRIHLFRGQIAEGRWLLEDAAAHYRRARAANPNDPWIEAELARVSLKLLDLDACRQHLLRQVQLSASSNLMKGQSLNISQTHIGQLIDEFCLDRSLLHSLQNIRRLPVEEQIEPLKELVLLNPDHTPSSMMLLIAMRQVGWLVSDLKYPLSATDSTIHRRIVQYWDTPDPPSEIVALMESWRTTHPNYEYIQYDDQTAQYFLSTRHSSDVLRAYQHARTPAQKADIFRLAYLAINGGFWVDADDRCLAPIHSFVPTDANLVTYQEDYGTLANNFLGASSGHPIIQLALDLVTDAANRGDGDLLWLSSGPGLLTRASSQIISRRDLRSTLRSEITIFDLATMQKFIGFHSPLRYKKTKKHWSRSSFGNRRN
jgi:mannosyltransferase OCH1-like enzyme